MKNLTQAEIMRWLDGELKPITFPYNRTDVFIILNHFQAKLEEINGRPETVSTAPESQRRY